HELQIGLVVQLGAPAVLVTPSAVGAVGRALGCLEALATRAVRPRAVVLLGPRDDFAEEQIRRHAPNVAVIGLSSPPSWDAVGVPQAAEAQITTLQRLRTLLEAPVERAWSPEELLARDRQVVWHPYTSLRDPDPPLVCVGAEAEHLFLADGRSVIDGISSWWT